MTLVAPATTCALSDNSEQARCTKQPAPRWDSWIEGQGVTPGQVTVLTSWLGWGGTGVGVSWPAYPSALHSWAGDQPAARFPREVMLSPAPQLELSASISDS